MKYSAGTLPHELLMASIELYGREVIAARARADSPRDDARERV